MTATVTRDGGASPSTAERALDAAGVHLPIAQRAALLGPSGYADTPLFVARAPDGSPLAAARVGIANSRALPGHRLYRLHRFTAASAASGRPLLDAVTAAALDDTRCLRLDIELFDRDPAVRRALAEALAALGFRKGTPRSYTHTLAVELDKSEEDVFAALGGRARRGVRAPEKKGLQLRVVETPDLAPRIARLLAETFDRRDTRPPEYPWPEIIAYSREEPSRSRVCGLFDAQATGEQSLVGFAWGCVHGTYGTFEAGASSRAPAYRSVSLGYAPIWDLIRWARGAGATWFDLGGVTAGTHGADDDPIGGISDFKRFFSEAVVEVAEEWTLEPSPARARLARMLSAAAERFRM